jgi:hypothetical protein
MEERPSAISLMTVIAFRARVTDGGPHGLKAGEALIGDWKHLGYSSERKYRTDMEKLKTIGWATFRATDKGVRRGTIATITKSSPWQVGYIDKQDDTDGSNDGSPDSLENQRGKSAKNRQKFDGLNDGSSDGLNQPDNSEITSLKREGNKSEKVPEYDPSDGLNDGSKDGRATDHRRITDEKHIMEIGNGKVHPRKITLERTEIPHAEKLVARLWYSRKDGPDEMAEYKAAEENLKRLKTEHSRFPR